MNTSSLIESWQREEAAPFAGWDFSHLAGRMLEEQPPWSYAARIAEVASRATALLDVDTGGGERLLALKPCWPAKVAATEYYPPNLALARERLVPLGAIVVDAGEPPSPLPFADGEFDLITNRHGSLDPAETARVLAPGGTFITEQVHDHYAHDLLALFDVPVPLDPVGPERYIPDLRRAGLEMVEVTDWTGGLAFTDVGAIVYYLHAIPWMVPRFSVATHQAQLLYLQAQLEREGLLRFTARTYLIEATKH